MKNEGSLATEAGLDPGFEATERRQHGAELYSSQMERIGWPTDAVQSHMCTHLLRIILATRRVNN